MYDLTPLYTAAFAGKGQSVAVVGQSFVDLGFYSDVSYFHGVLAPGAIGTITDVLVPGSGVEAISPGDELESDIDLEIDRIAERSSESPRKVRARLEKEDMIEALAAEILEQRALDLVLEHATYEDVELKSEDEEGNVATVEAEAAPGASREPSATEY